MKKIRKPKIVPVVCRICHGEYQPNFRNLTVSKVLHYGVCSNIKDTSTCPWCKAENVVQFEKPEVVDDGRA